MVVICIFLKGIIDFGLIRFSISIKRSMAPPQVGGGGGGGGFALNAPSWIRH